ncbi:MAG: 50S ribosomal protein L21e [Candidatus Woesearchaeota archaeon]
MKRIGSSRRKTRHIYTKEKSEKGKLSIRAFMQEFQPGDRVGLVIEPAYQKGIFFRRYQGKCGVVERKLGSCYEISLKDFNKEKKIIAHPVHLKKLI